jgi:hypothetical protein
MRVSHREPTSGVLIVLYIAFVSVDIDVTTLYALQLSLKEPKDGLLLEFRLLLQENGRKMAANHKNELTHYFLQFELETGPT